MKGVFLLFLPKVECAQMVCLTQKEIQLQLEPRYVVERDLISLISCLYYVRSSHTHMYSDGNSTWACLNLKTTKKEITIPMTAHFWGCWSILPTGKLVDLELLKGLTSQYHHHHHHLCRVHLREQDTLVVIRWWLSIGCCSCCSGFDINRLAI